MCQFQTYCLPKFHRKLYKNKENWTRAQFKSTISIIKISGADPGFLVGGDVNPPGRGANIQICQIFIQNCIKLKKFWSVVGGGDPPLNIYVSLRLRVQNAVSTQPCVGKLGISLVLLNFLDCNFRL